MAAKFPIPSVRRGIRKTVYIVNTSALYQNMFKNQGWDPTEELSQADLVQFTGGSDVTPSFYKQFKHETTKNDLNRDIKEAMIFQHCLANIIPMAGICRGAQFLNVMMGGTLWQDCDGHSIVGVHDAFDAISKERVEVTSTHHQIMIPNSEEGGMVTLVARKSKVKARMKELEGQERGEIVIYDRSASDVEAILYQDANVFCFQPHPEYSGVATEKIRKDLRDYYFHQLIQYIM